MNNNVDFYMPPEARTRFWSNVDTSPGPSKCWPWRGRANQDGYGKFNVPKQGGGYRFTQATRVMVFLTAGPFPKSLLVRHKCDNPICVNPAHLELGTHLDNARDMTDRQRQSRGELHPKTTIAERVVIEIRERAVKGEAFTAIARDMGLNTNTVAGIAKGRTWKHVPGSVVTDRRRLDPDKVAEARLRVSRGESINSVATDLGMQYTSLVTAVRGRHPRWAVDINGVPPVPPQPRV